MGRSPRSRAPYVSWLTDADANRASVGGKGASLARLLSLGAAVPTACALTTAAYRDVAKALHLPRRTAEIRPDELFSIRERIENAALPDDISAAINQAYLHLEERAGQGVELAARSSATVEDAESWSFAGLHDTVLGIRSIEGLERAVRQCWASLWSDRAVQYRMLAGLDTDRCAIAVVVQQLVRCDVSFVLFTADPVSGRADHGVIIASWGLGEAVVSGAVTPDHIVVSRDGMVVSYEIGHKEQMVIAGTPPADGTRLVPVPALLRSVPVLSEEQVADIAAMGYALEASLGYPADIEGGVVDGQVFVFQARPITTILNGANRGINRFGQK